ncbi:MAG: ABC transporter substrate-binding protein, partial [Euryarchaeota archaeon]|nr:ABC transporter substrate-binding protein [Euryarchaeota archaeon]
ELGNTELQTVPFNAGPTAIEALLAHRVDVIYVGPSPTINLIANQGLDLVVIVSGSASGGAMFVVREDVPLEEPADYVGKKFATPQIGNTQDVALKHYLLQMGLKSKDRGGNIDVINQANADILTLFEQGQVEGAWVPEPWATRLVREQDARVQVNESELWENGDFVTTHLVTTRKFAEERRADLESVVAAHYKATERIRTGSPEALDAINEGIRMATGRRIDDATLAAAFQNLRFTNDPLRETFRKQYEMAHDIGFAKEPPSDLERVYALDIRRPTEPTGDG